MVVKGRHYYVQMASSCDVPSRRLNNSGTSGSLFSTKNVVFNIGGFSIFEDQM